MLEVSFEQVSTAVGTIVFSLTAAIGFLMKWILSMIAELKTKLDSCEAKHTEQYNQLRVVVEKSAKLEGRVEEMERLNPTEIATQVALTLGKMLKEQSNVKSEN